MRVITVSAGPERFPVRNEINIRCPCRRTGEGDKRPLSVQQHVIEQVRSGPAKTAGWVHQFGLGQPFQIRGHGAIRSCHGKAGTVNVDVRHRATIDDTHNLRQSPGGRKCGWPPPGRRRSIHASGTCPGRLRQHWSPASAVAIQASSCSPRRPVRMRTAAGYPLLVSVTTSMSFDSHRRRSRTVNRAYHHGMGLRAATSRAEASHAWAALVVVGVVVCAGCTSGRQHPARAGSGRPGRIPRRPLAVRDERGRSPGSAPGEPQDVGWPERAGSVRRPGRPRWDSAWRAAGHVDADRPAARGDRPRALGHRHSGCRLPAGPRGHGGERDADLGDRPGQRRCALTVINAADALDGRPAIVGDIPAGLFPRDMTLAPNGTVLVSNFSSGQLETVDTATIP